MKSIQELTKETNGQTKLLWHEGYWDGPHNGIMLWNGKRCWFESFNERQIIVPFNEKEIEEWEKICKKEKWEFDINDCHEVESYRQFKVYDIPIRLMKQKEKRHNLFKMYVGSHTDYDDDAKRTIENLKPQTLWVQFYKRCKWLQWLDRTRFFTFKKIDKTKSIGEFEL